MVQVICDKSKQTTSSAKPPSSERSTQVPRSAERKQTVTREEWEEGRDELEAQRIAGVLDCGQDDDSDSSDLKLPTVAKAAGRVGQLGDREGLCFSKLCEHFGVTVAPGVRSVKDLDQKQLLALRQSSDNYKVYYEYYTDNDDRNHVAPAISWSKSARVEVHYLAAGRDGGLYKTVGVTSKEQFFNISNMYANVKFYADVMGGDGSEFVADPAQSFGADLDDQPTRPVGRGGARAALGTAGSGVFDDTTAGATRRGSGATEYPPGLRRADEPRQGSRGARESPTSFGGADKFKFGPPREGSVVDDSAESGLANVSGGVKRAKRRVVAGRSKFNPSASAAKSYTASNKLMFNNLNEMFQDMVSRDYAQEILEAVFDHWGVPRGEPDALKYAEDLVSAFFIATTASNKADYDFEYTVPTAAGEVTADFGVLSRTLAEQFGVTRRQFARGMADEFRAYLKDPDNTHLLSRLADRAGCDPQMAYLAFDGSTHCSGLTSSQLTFVKMLEGRNLFEDESAMAQGYSQSIMEGVHGRIKSKVSR